MTLNNTTSQMQSIQDAFGELLASNLDEQCLKQQDVAFELKTMAASLDAKELTTELGDVTDVNTYAEKATRFVERVLAIRQTLDRSLAGTLKLQKNIEEQTQSDLAAANKSRMPLHEWYRKYGRAEFERENQSRTRLAAANAIFQESQLRYVAKIYGQVLEFLDGLDNIKAGMNEPAAVQIISDLRDLLRDAGSGPDSAFGLALQDLRTASKRSRDLLEAAARHQGQVAHHAANTPSPYEESKLFRALNIKDCDAALALIDRQINVLTGNDGAVQELVDKLNAHEKQLMQGNSRTRSPPLDPFLPPDD